MNELKETMLTCIFALCVYVALCMLMGKTLYGLPVNSCAVFQDGTKFNGDNIKQIDAYHEKTGQSFDYMECE